MRKKILLLGALYHAEASLAAELQHSTEYELISTFEPGVLGAGQFQDGKNPYVNLPTMFNSHVCSTSNIAQWTNNLIDIIKPDITMVRCWSPFANVKIPEHVFWKIESYARGQGDGLKPLLPNASAGAFLTQAPAEIDEYKPLLSIPVGPLPRGVSHHWEKPMKKTVEVMSTGSAMCKAKIDWFNILVKPICEVLPKESVHVYVNLGRGNIGLPDNMKPPYLAEEGPRKFAEAKIFLCPIQSFYSPDFISHKTLQAMGCRTLVVMPKYMDAEKLFGKDGETLVYANSSAECLDKVKYYLKHEDEREAIAQRGYDFIHSEYNYTKLLKKAFNCVGLE